MAEEYLIEKGVSPKVDAEIDKLTGKIEKLAETLGKVNNLGDIYPKDGATTQQFEALKQNLDGVEQGYKRVTTARQKYANEQERQDAIQKRAYERLLAQANSTSIYADELKRLNAQIILNGQQIAKLSLDYNKNKDEVIRLQQENTKLTAEYGKMQEATGQLARKQTSMYGATFQLTQIMRELPNFAISARIGFMSLSNNLPMLIDSFKMLSERVDETGKKLGKVGALKAFAQSLLSLNTVLIVVSTLFIMFGDEIGKFINQIFKANDSIITLKKANENISKQFKENTNSVGESIVKYKELQEKWNALGSDLNAKNKFVKENADEFYNLGIEVNNVADAENKLVENSDAVIEAIRNKALALAGQQLAAKEYEKAVLEQIKADKKLTEADNTRKNQTTNFSDVLRDTRSGVTSTKEMAEQRARSFEYEASKHTEMVNTFIANGDKYLRISSDMKNKAEGVLGTPIKPKGKSGSGDVVQTGKEILIAIKAYNEERIKLIVENKELEDKLSKENLDGELNSYEQREEASKQYYKNTIRILEIEKANAEFEAREKAKKAVADLENTHERNTALYKAKKISLEQFTLLEQQYSDGAKAITENLNIDLLEINDKYREGESEADKTFRKNSLNRLKDKYAEEIRIIDAGEKAKIDAINLKYNRDVDKTTQLSNAEIFAGAFGYNKNTKVAEAELNKGRNYDVNQAQIWSIRNKLQKAKEGSQEYIELMTDLEAKEREARIQLADDSRQVENAIYEEQKDLKAEIAEATVNMLKEIWNQYWKWELKELDKQSKKYKKIEDNKLKDIEDREEAGVISKEEAEAEKLRTKIYYESVQDELDKQREEKERKQFLFSQLFALGQVWINYAMNASKQGINPITQGLLLALAIAQSGIIAAQTIPMFEKGTDYFGGGLAIVGEKRKEVVKLPDNRYFITPDNPTLYDLPRGTQIFPDAVKWEKSIVDKHTALMQVNGGVYDERMYLEMRELKRELKNKKMSVRINNASVLKQMNYAKYLTRWKNGI